MRPFCDLQFEDAVCLPGGAPPGGPFVVGLVTFAAGFGKLARPDRGTAGPSGSAMIGRNKS